MYYTFRVDSGRSEVPEILLLEWPGWMVLEMGRPDLQTVEVKQFGDKVRQVWLRWLEQEEKTLKKIYRCSDGGHEVMEFI